MMMSSVSGIHCCCCTRDVKFALRCAGKTGGGMASRAAALNGGMGKKNSVVAVQRCGIRTSDRSWRWVRPLSVVLREPRLGLLRQGGGRAPCVENPRREVLLVLEKESLTGGIGSGRRWRGRATMSLVGPECGRMLFCALAACAAVGQVLESRTEWGCRASAPLLAMGGGLLLSTTGVIPATAAAYDLVLALGMPMAVAMSLLETDVMRAFTDAGATLKAFWFGALGTIIGTVVAFSAVGRLLGPSGWKIASSLCASYVGGTINYAATAQALGMTSPSLLAAGMAADNLAMAVYFGIIMSIPTDAPAAGKEFTIEPSIEETQVEPEVNPTVESLAISMAAAASACMLGNWIASALPPQFAGSGLAMMAVVASVFSTIASLVSRKWGAKNNGTSIPIFAGAQSLGGVLMLLFFTVVGASTRVQEALVGGWPLFVFILILVLVHLAVMLTLGAWTRCPMRTLLIASNANIGGPATAAAMASSKRWPSLVRPALLVGTLGYTVGTGIGCLVGIHFLQPMLQTAFLL